MNHLVFSEGKLLYSSEDSILKVYRLGKLPADAYVYRIERNYWYNSQFNPIFTNTVPPIYRTLALLLS